MEFDEFAKNTETDGYSPDLDSQFAPLPPDMGTGFDFGQIDAISAAGSALLPLPVRIAHGEHYGKNSGFGIRHILIEHGEELAIQEYSSVQEFVRDVLLDFDAVYQSHHIGRALLVCHAKNGTGLHRIVVIEMHKSGKCYAVITGWTRDGWRKLKEMLIWKSKG